MRSAGRPPRSGPPELTPRRRSRPPAGAASRGAERAEARCQPPGCTSAPWLTSTPFGGRSSPRCRSRRRGSSRHAGEPRRLVPSPPSPAAARRRRHSPAAAAGMPASRRHRRGTRPRPQHRGAASAQLDSAAAPRAGGIERHVGAARLEHAEHRHHQLGRALEADPDAHLGTRRRAAAAARPGARRAGELAVGQLAPARQRAATARGVAPPAPANSWCTVSSAAAAPAPGGVVPLHQQLVPLRRGRAAAARGERRAPAAPPRRRASAAKCSAGARRGAVSKRSARRIRARPGRAPPPPALDRRERQIEPARSAAPASPGPAALRAGRAPAAAPRPALERQILVGVGGERRLAHRASSSRRSGRRRGRSAAPGC
jgi:hypothetical protein